MEGYPALICFLWDGQTEPLLIPFSEYEDIFRSTTPASDGQYKVQIIMMQGGTEFYLARVGKFNAEAYYGWQGLEDLLDKTNHEKIPELSHSQVQTLLGSIGAKKDYDIWIPQMDRPNLDWNIAKHFFSRDSLPSGFERVNDVIQEVDVIWLKKGSNFIQGLFEVEHSTPVYSGLLRFNDILLSVPTLQTRYSIVANSERRSLFIKQLNRPTFQASGLNVICTFLDYGNVYNWHKRIAVQGKSV